MSRVQHKIDFMLMRNIWRGRCCRGPSLYQHKAAIFFALKSGRVRFKLATSDFILAAEFKLATFWLASRLPSPIQFNCHVDLRRAASAEFMTLCVSESVHFLNKFSAATYLRFIYIKLIGQIVVNLVAKWFEVHFNKKIHFLSRHLSAFLTPKSVLDYWLNFKYLIFAVIIIS